MRLDCVGQSPVNANLTLIGGLNLIHLRRKIKSLIGQIKINKMADLLFGLPCMRQRRARIYRYSDSILIYCYQKLRTRHRFGRASIEYNTNLIEADLQRKTNCYYALKPIDQVLIALQFYVSGGLLQVVSDTTGVDKSTVSLAVHNADAILEAITVLTHGKFSALWDTNCQLARQ